MFFYTQAYLLFFAIVFACYWALPWHRARIWLLLGASIYFYAKWSQWLAFLVTTTTLMDYLLARAMDATASPRKRKWLLGTSISVNLGILAYFKYVDFFLESLQQALATVGASREIPLLKLMVPFGISFYTFEAISYAVDVYRKKIPAEKSLPNFMLFILFFPHLIAGPIVRAGDFLRQARKPKRFRWLRMQLGVEYFLIGLFKKLVIADSMALYSDAVLGKDADPSTLSWQAVWIGVIAFSIRIYCDFSGYSDMALGCAHMLGYKLTINFRMPYLAANVSEFWRRWHISLSSWLRDYLFIPMGGSRGPGWKVVRNLMITMMLGGLWHGASMSFLIWGTFHGGLLVVHRWFRRFALDRPLLETALQTWLGTLFRIGLTYFCVMICWVFFQPSLPKALVILERMFSPVDGLGFAMTKGRYWFCLGMLLVGHLAIVTGFWKRFAPRCPAPALGFGYAILLILCLLLNPDTSKAFIYFQF